MATASELNSLADAPGTSREYETIYVLRPGTTNEGVAEINERIRNIIESLSGKIVKVDNWGKRRLAYEVEKERKGIYLYWQYLASRGVVAEIERNLRMLDSVIRYMTVKIDQDVDPEVRPIEVDETTYERAANTAADEEDLYLSSRVGGGDDDDDDDYGDDDDDDIVPGAKSAAAADDDADDDDAAADDDDDDDDLDETDDTDGLDDIDDTDEDKE